MCILCILLCRFPLTKPNRIPFFFFTIIFCYSYIIKPTSKAAYSSEQFTNCFLHFFTSSFYYRTIVLEYINPFLSYCKDPFLFLVRFYKIFNLLFHIFLIKPKALFCHVFPSRYRNVFQLFWNFS